MEKKIFESYAKVQTNVNTLIVERMEAVLKILYFFDGYTMDENSFNNLFNKLSTDNVSICFKHEQIVFIVENKELLAYAKHKYIRHNQISFEVRYSDKLRTFDYKEFEAVTKIKLNAINRMKEVFKFYLDNFDKYMEMNEKIKRMYREYCLNVPPLLQEFELFPNNDFYDLFYTRK